jgi:O-antigen/teichoic acid export membrane protein
MTDTIPAPESEGGPEDRGLERRAARGLGYAILTFACERGLIFAATLVLARILVPQQFGVVAFALAVLNYLGALTDLGLGSALIYRADGTDDDVSSTSFWLSMSGAAFLAVAMFLAAPAIANLGVHGATARHEVVPLLRALSLTFPLSALGNVHEYRLRAKLEFRKLFAPQFAGALVQGLASLIGAIAGAGAWSLIIGQLLGELTHTVMLWKVHPWRPRLTIARAKVSSLLTYGLGIVAVGLLGNGAKNIDFIVVSARLGAAALGFYYLAFRLPELVVLSVFQIANDVLFPFYARLNDAPSDGTTEALRSGYLESVRLAAVVAFPAAFGMAALATPIVLVFYGQRWHAAIHPLMFVAIWTGLASMASMPGAVFKATGRSWLMTSTGIMQLAILVPAVLISVHWGITAVAASQVIEKTISLTLLGIVCGRVIRVPWYASWIASAPAIAMSAVTAAIVYWIARALPPVPALLVGVPVGVWVYLTLVRIFMPEVFRKVSKPVAEIVARRRHAGAVAGAS